MPWASVACMLAAAAAVGVGCGPHNQTRQAENAQAPIWSSPVNVGPYQVFFHFTWQPRQRQCLLAAIDGRWSDWAVSTRGVFQVGRHKYANIYVHSLDADIGPTTSLTPNIRWTGIGDGQAIHIRPADHRMPRLMLAIDAHQDPQLDPTWTPARTDLLLKLDDASLVALYPIQQAIGCHR